MKTFFSSFNIGTEHLSNKVFLTLLQSIIYSYIFLKFNLTSLNKKYLFTDIYILHLCRFI